MCLDCSALQIRMELKHLKTKNQKAAAKHQSEMQSLQVSARLQPATLHLYLPRCMSLAQHFAQ